MTDDEPLPDPMTVGKLREVLEGVPDDAPLFVEVDAVTADLFHAHIMSGPGPTDGILLSGDG